VVGGFMNFESFLYTQRLSGSSSSTSKYEEREVYSFQ
jgi:hypothetical protein